MRIKTALLRMIFSLILGLTFVMVSQSAYAQKKSRFRPGTESRNSKQKAAESETKDSNIIREDGKLVLYKKRNVVDFDDSLIEGEVKNPSEFYFVHRPEEKFNSLVQRRKNFQKEMLRDTVMIR